MKWGEAKSNNLNWGELSAFNGLELKTKQLNEICDQLTRNEITIPQDIIDETSPIFAEFDKIKSITIKTLPDFIHVTGIFCRLYASTPKGNTILPQLIIATDALLQFYRAKKSSEPHTKI